MSDDNPPNQLPMPDWLLKEIMGEDCGLSPEEVEALAIKMGGVRVGDGWVIGPAGNA